MEEDFIVCRRIGKAAARERLRDLSRGVPLGDRDPECELLAANQSLQDRVARLVGREAILAGLHLAVDVPKAGQQPERQRIRDHAGGLELPHDVAERRALGDDHVGLRDRERTVDVDRVAEPERSGADDDAGADHDREGDADQGAAGSVHRRVRASHVSRIPTAAS